MALFDKTNNRNDIPRDKVLIRKSANGQIKVAQAQRFWRGSKGQVFLIV